MTVKTLRLTPEDKALLARIVRETGLTASDVLKRGLRALERELKAKPAMTPWEIYQSLGVGEDDGDEARAAGPATEMRKTVRDILERKRARWSL